LSTQSTLRSPAAKGVISATIVLVGWLISLISLLRLDLFSQSTWCLAAAVLVRTAFQTALFITAHDAMHGVLAPSAPAINHRIGAWFLLLYAGLPYRSCLRKHHNHHHFSGGRLDPDFCTDASIGVWGWYRSFMAGYLSQGQMIRLLGLWLGIAVLATADHATGWCNVLVVCVAPLLLSSWQLFVFGTYLPHRIQQQAGDRQAPTSMDLPVWLSLLTCFHFGYHREHHERPQLAWFELPAEHRRRSALAAS
jgi:beta-carotene ketolase (CrtW type)